jgi:lipopolysaccharide export system permease protein
MNLLKFASLIVSKGVAFSQISTVFIALIPTFLEISIPMAMLLGVMLGFARLSGDSEIIVIRASGISISTLIIPVCALALIVTIFGLLVSHSARPWGYNTLNETLLQIASSSSTAGLEKGVFSELGELTLYAETLDHETGQMSHVLLDDKREEQDRKIVFASTGTIASDPKTNRLYISLERGQIHQVTQKGYAVTKFDKNISVVEPDELFGTDKNKKGKQLSAMYSDELQIIGTAYQETLTSIKNSTKQNGVAPTISDFLELPTGQRISPQQYNKKELSKRVNRVKLEKGRRLSMPFAALAMALIGMSLGIQSPRTQRSYGMGLSASLGLAVFVIYYSTLSFGIAMAEGGSINPTLALWIPNITVILIASWFLKKLSAEKWQSVLEAASSIRFRMK